MDHADVRYLESKRTVDRRARSRRVRDALLAALPAAPDVVEVGAGTGAFVRDLLEWGVRGSYRGVDRAEPLVARARETLPGDLADDYAVERTGNGFVAADLSVRFEAGDALALSPGAADLVVGQAVLDLVPIGAAMDAVERALTPGGLAYLPITFDGVTLFQPDHPGDDAVIDAYHAHIDAREGRDSRAGRHLLDHLRDREGELLAVDASDWIVRPRGGTYPADERYFLECILGFVADALGERGVDADDWLAARRRHLADAALAYVAHQYDFLYRAPG
ncbi:SAM-dependent methyltransferase [Halobacteriales archaeon QS_1_68_17]|nr:MAG: SAM-dependent methyltransferase [Halobacteriales archaeon QS_1_68_17]